MITAPVPVFYYHSIGYGALCISPEAFRRQMTWLKRSGFRCLTASEWVRGDDGVGRVAVVTFDDGFAGVGQYAGPILKALGLKATVFVPVTYPGGSLWGSPATRRWMPTPGADAIRYPLMTWDALKALVDQGWEIGGHGVTHQNLTDLAPSEARDEIIDSRRQLHARLGATVDAFCYPRGRSSRELERAVEAAGYVCAFSTVSGLAGPASNRFALPRIAAGPYLSDFALVARGRTHGPFWPIIRRASVPLERLWLRARSARWPSRRAS